MSLMRILLEALIGTFLMQTSFINMEDLWLEKLLVLMTNL